MRCGCIAAPRGKENQLLTSIHRSALLPYSDEQLFRLVNDIEAYPEYLDGCVGAQVLYSDGVSMEARLDLARGGIAQSFVTVNELTPHERISLRLKRGPFDAFSGAWQFQSLAADACKVSLDLEFTVRSALVGAAAGRLFDAVAGSLVDAVVRRARELYGT